MQDYDGFREIKCDFCGRNFIYNPHSVYRRVEKRTKHFCKYTCMTAYDRERAEKKKAATA